MITNQELSLKIQPVDDEEAISVTARNDGTTELVFSRKIVVRTATLIALGIKLQAIYPGAINEAVE